MYNYDVITDFKVSMAAKIPNKDDIMPYIDDAIKKYPFIKNYDIKRIYKDDNIEDLYDITLVITVQSHIKSDDKNSAIASLEYYTRNSLKDMRIEETVISSAVKDE